MRRTKKVTNNRDNLIMAIAWVEDIYRTNNRIHELLRGLMSNPDELTNIKTSINDLHNKVTNLRNSDIGIPLIEEEHVLTVHGSGFSKTFGKGYFRIVFLPHPEIINQAFDNIEKFINRHKYRIIEPKS